LIGATVFNLH